MCGSDLRLYPSECELRREACERQQPLNPRPLVLCQGLSSGSPGVVVSILVDLVFTSAHGKVKEDGCGGLASHSALCSFFKIISVQDSFAFLACCLVGL